MTVNRNDAIPASLDARIAARLPLNPPRATVRVQLNHQFGFDAALAILPYFERMGISHLFVSPILTARAGSMHGYDVVDHGQVNPELGGEEGLRRLVAGLRARGMGLIVDVVPNHMAVGGADNARWLEMLEWGRDSRYARFFDIDWDVPDPALHGRVLAPFLGEAFGDALAEGKLVLCHENGRFFVRYYDHRFPIAPAFYPGLLGAHAALAAPQAAFARALRVRGREARRIAFEDAVGALAVAAVLPDADDAIAKLLASYNAPEAAARKRLQRLLERQHYRLAWWRTAADEINWRRFFDITELSALRIQERPVFEAVHATIFRLYAAGLIDGLRIDHVDGLADPRGYCRQLRARLLQLTTRRPSSAPREAPYVVVEKIVAPGEKLAADWQVDGTSGYSFMNDVAALLHDPGGEASLTRIWSQHSGSEFADEERRARRRIPQELFPADLSACAHALHAIARSDPSTRDWTLAAVRRVLIELLVHFPVYRTYADARGRSAADAAIMAQVVEAALQTCRPSEQPLLRAVDRWLGGEPARAVPGFAARRLRLRALARFQQLTSPVAAKAVEDTAFYRHGRLLSRNEVGADPGCFSIDAEDFHRICADRQRRYPRALLATATHDHKRGEDVRMRLAVLSETPDRWQDAVREWHARNAPLRGQLPGGAPDEIDEYILYQMMIGSWPLDLRADDADGLHAFAERLCAWQRKAVREAKRHSGWIEPNAAYEDACENFVRQLLDPSHSSRSIASMIGLVDTIAAAGAIKSLSQTALRLSTPGIPDLYQGTEYWDFSMVDPDNRQSVDFSQRAQTLAASATSAELLARWRDGAIKQRLIARMLALRRAQAAVFASGIYLPLPLHGPQATRAIAYARVLRETAVVVIAPRFAHGLLETPDALRIPPSAWGRTMVQLPRTLRELRWRDVLDDRPLGTLGKGRLVLDAVLDPWPLAVLVSER